MNPILNPKTTLLGGVVAGIGASACCLGPLLLLSMGIGGAWIAHLTALEPYRPIVIVITIVFLGVTFWRLYLVAPSCDVGDNCIAERTLKVQRILFWILLPVVLLLLVSPWILPYFYR